MSDKPKTREERYQAFRRQVEWDGWSKITREVFDQLFPDAPEPPDPSLTELLGMRSEK